MANILYVKKISTWVIILVAGLAFFISNAYANRALQHHIAALQGQIAAGTANLRAQIGTPDGFMGVYREVGRHNDIFTFCRYGMPQHSWVSVNPVTGHWAPINWWHLNPTFIPHFVVLCPLGGQSPGAWTGPGSGSQFKGNPHGNPPLIPFPH